MNIVLHVGAHRTGTSTLQRVLQNNAVRLRQRGVASWGPARTRTGCLVGVPGSGRAARAGGAILAAEGRAEIDEGLAWERDAGATLLVVSEENILGTMDGCLLRGWLYPDAGARVARTVAAFGASCCRVGLAIRSPDDWWASVLSYQAMRRASLPGQPTIDRIAAADRGWRHVIADIARACPGVDLVVWDFAALIGDPAAQLSALAGRTLRLPPQARTRHVNATRGADSVRAKLMAAGHAADAARVPPGPARWMPFHDTQRQVMQQSYAADLAWLRAGADGCARFVEAGTQPMQGRTANGGKQGRLGAAG
jgi:hypothetical protein